MKIPALVILLIVISGGFLYFKNTPLEKVIPEQIIPSTTGMTENRAIEIIKKRSEVQQYLKDVPTGKVEVDNQLEGEYNVHVYEVKNGHTATFNWYRVSIKSGEVRAEFEVEQESSNIPTGTVSGKVCYPSDIIPQGKLQVKRLMDGKITEENYPGSIEGTEPTYSFQLEPGDYYIRYNVEGKIFGYSTTVCPTGNETTCANTKQRVPVMAVVKDGQELKNYDLCDYFYKPSNAPKF